MISISQNTVYLVIIGLLMALQIWQWYYINDLRKQMQAVWSQIVTIALMLSMKDSQKNEQQENKD